MKIKPKIAIFDLTGCEGCQFHLLTLNELLLDFFQDFDIVNWRLLSEKESADFDVAFVEGAVTTKKHIKLLKEIRETSKIIVAIGSCAISGNFFAQLSKEERKKIAEKIYGKNYKLKGEFLEPVENFIKVDEKIPGCPPDIEQIKEFLKKLKKQEITSKIKKVSPPDYTAQIEGHGILEINFKKGEVKFNPEESERLVEELLVGKNYQQAPFVTSRICGICPTAHNICSLSGIENALGINVPKEILILRKILMAGQIIKSHLLHLFFLALPDYAGVKSSVLLVKKYPAEFHLMLNIKRAIDEIFTTIGGSPTFPLTTKIGGFISFPNHDKLLNIRHLIFDIKDEAQDLIKLFSGFKIPNLKVKTKLLTITPPIGSYPYYPGTASKEIKEVLNKNSPAKLAVLKNGEIIKVGALARLSYYSDFLHPKAKRALSEFPVDFQNPFHNNLAQAIEILHFLEEAALLIEEISKKKLNESKNQKIQLPKNTAIGQASIEAPRGVLSHEVRIDSEGKIISYNIIPPTQINLNSLEKEAKELIKKEEKLSPLEIKKIVEQLIRAFDPCITCAVH